MTANGQLNRAHEEITKHVPYNTPFTVSFPRKQVLTRQEIGQRAGKTGPRVHKGFRGNRSNAREKQTRKAQEGKQEKEEAEERHVGKAIQFIVRTEKDHRVGHIG